MLVQAMEEAGSSDPSVVKDTLLGMKYESMGGEITYDETVMQRSLSQLKHLRMEHLLITAASKKCHASAECMG